ncbi:MAG: thioredoxin family protein [Betaproteobacteria bacterium]|nr:thioredoxin family protein [Betaproteobacteria bacterium]
MKLITVLAAIVLSLAASVASALEIKSYSPELLATAQAAGKPVALHFHADWCPTCRAQEDVFNTLESDRGFAMTLLVADYDKERELKRKLNVRSQSTLIVYRGKIEKARLAGETSAEKLKAALRSAL